MVSMRLKRFGTKKRPYYRVVIVDSREANKGKSLKEIGYYHPMEAEDKQFSVDVEQVKEWFQKGAQPSPTVKSLLNKHGIYVERKVQD